MNRSLSSRAALLFAVFGCASGARAELAVYHLGRGRSAVRLISSDGYHYASFTKAGWSVDGQPFAPDEGAEAVNRGTADCQECAAFSADGRVLLSVARVRAQDGTALYSPAANGKRFGSPLPAVTSVQIAPKGENAVFTVRGPKGCYVVSNAGAGPAFAGCPDPVIASDKGVLYAAKWNDRTIIYRDHQVVANTDYWSMEAAPDLSRFAGVLHSDGGSGLDTVVIGTDTIARLKVSEMFFSQDGRHLGLKGGKVGQLYDTIIVDGKTYDAPGVNDFSMRPGDGLPFWIAAKRFFKAGKDLGLVGWVPGTWRSQGRWLGFSPSAAHYAFVATDENATIGRIMVDGEVVEENAPAPVGDAHAVFDGEKEFHYLGSKSGDDSISLVCGTVDGSDPRRTRCARFASSHKSKAEAE
jgi:hypothetical protein